MNQKWLECPLPSASFHTWISRGHSESGVWLPKEGMECGRWGPIWSQIMEKMEIKVSEPVASSSEDYYARFTSLRGSTLVLCSFASALLENWYCYQMIQWLATKSIRKHVLGHHFIVGYVWLSKFGSSSQHYYVGRQFLISVLHSMIKSSYDIILLNTVVAHIYLSIFLYIYIYIYMYIYILSLSSQVLLNNLSPLQQ